eukprot:m.216817 g.216817  ORF g.216817 m.216817 type:complete len:232 (-) comp15882_c0_seq7:197-892(-)
MASFRGPGLLFLATCLCLQTCSSIPAIPFGSRPPNVYQVGTLFPTVGTRQQRDDAVTTLYEEWKTKYLRSSCETGEYYVQYVDEGNGQATVSEAHAYGMLISVYMAGYDNGSKAIFDGLVLYWRSHRSIINNQCMGWKQETCSNINFATAATDGDMDIAYAFLLADVQWTSNGVINYRSEASDIITGCIQKDQVTTDGKLVLLGDWARVSRYCFANSNKNKRLYFKSLPFI